MFKVCNRCEQAKHETEFNRKLRVGKTPSLASMCRECNKEYKSDLYRDEPFERIRLRLSTRARKNSKRDLVKKIKDVPCVDCGGRFPSAAMDFDHVKGVKSFNIAHGVKNKTWAEIEEEIAKCEIVCSNCHRVRTRERGRKSEQRVEEPAEN
jgi:hypothetical protein